MATRRVVIIAIMMNTAALLRRAAAASRAGGRPVRPQVALNSSAHASAGACGLVETRALAVRNLSTANANAKPLGLKAGVTGSGMSPTMRMLFGYITVALAAVATVARYKSRDEEGDEVGSVCGSLQCTRALDRAVGANGSSTCVVLYVWLLAERAHL